MPNDPQRTAELWPEPESQRQYNLEVQKWSLNPFQTFLQKYLGWSASEQEKIKARQPAALAQLALGFMPLPIGEIQAWHGSPRKGWFQPTLEDVGKGEGAQAFGHGYYSTTEPEIAAHYARPRSVTIGDITISPHTQYEVVSELGDELIRVAQSEGAVKTRRFNLLRKKLSSSLDFYNTKLREFQNRYNEASQRGDQAGIIIQKNNIENWTYTRNQYQKIKDEIDRGAIPEAESEVKPVTLHRGKAPEEHPYLDWQAIVPPDMRKRIIAQVEKEFPSYDVKLLFPKETRLTWAEYKRAWPDSYSESQLRSMYEAYSKLPDPDVYTPTDGGLLYNRIKTMLSGKAEYEGMRSDAAASAFLNRAGIKGIKYPAGTLSGHASEAVNYVTFDPAEVSYGHVAKTGEIWK